MGADSVVPMVSVPLAYFESTVSATVDKMIRKPTKGMLGTKLRAPPAFHTVKAVLACEWSGCIGAEASAPSSTLTSGLLIGRDYST